MRENEQGMARFEKIIMELETVVDVGLKIPGLGKVISEKDVKTLLTALHASVKEAIEEAQEIVSFRDEILREANEQAEEIVRVRNLEVSKQPIIRDAEDAAREILMIANTKAEEKVRTADAYEDQVKTKLFQYSDVVFGEIEMILNEKRKMVEQNRIQMNNVLSQQISNNEEARQEVM